MSLKERLKADLLQARKTNNTVARNILQVLLGEVEVFEQGSVRPGVTAAAKVMSDEEVQSKIRKLIESNTETIAANPAAVNAVTLGDENRILQSYLPTYLTQEQIRGFVEERADLAAAVRSAGKDGPAIGLVSKALKEAKLDVLGSDVKDVVVAIRTPAV